MSGQGMVVWSELMTTEAEKARAFYERTLGVSFESFDPTGEGNYWVAMADGKPAWGLMDMTARPDAGPAVWFTYIGVDDVDARVAAAVEAGATLCTPIFEIPTVGRIAILRDVTGAMIGWMRPAMTDQ